MALGEQPHDALPVSHLFWNVAPGVLDVHRSRKMIIEAVLARGTWEDAQWLFQAYGREGIAEFVRADVETQRRLPRAARKLWATVLCPEIPRALLEDRPGEPWNVPSRTRASDHGSMGDG